MEKYKDAELKLNEFSVPTHFHDMSVINMKFSDDSIIVRFSLAKYLDEFDRKLEYLLSTLTADELKIYNYSVLAREQDKQVRDRICKTDKTYYPIKKSCYVKLALRFGLVDGFTKNVFATISLFD